MVPHGVKSVEHREPAQGWHMHAGTLDFARDDSSRQAYDSSAKRPKPEPDSSLTKKKETPPEGDADG